MKTTELMVKDWVLHEGEPYQIRQLGIYGVDRDGEDYPAVCVGKPKGVGLIVDRNEIEPIPLTPEILEKNGFKKDEKLEEMYYWNWGIGNNCVSYDKETGIVRIFHVFGHLVFVLPLSYVHELQHALRLCGIEKEIIL